jgi:excisionase family DNA binding protein
MAEFALSERELDQLADLVAERVAARVAKRENTTALMSVNDAAKVLGCHPKTVRRRIAAGVLPAVREQERVVIRTDDLEGYITRLERTGARMGARRPRRHAPGARDYDFLDARSAS